MDYYHHNLQGVKKKFKDFIRQFHSNNFNYKYRDTLKRNYNLRQYYLEVNLEDLGSFNETLAEKIVKQPTKHSPVFEEAAKEVADELTSPRGDGEENVEDIQIMLSSDAASSNLRELKSQVVSRLVKIPGIIVSASGIKAKATKITIQCRSCQNVIPNLPVKPGLEGYLLPRKCNTEQAGRDKCPLDPYFIVPDKCTCVDFRPLLTSINTTCVREFVSLLPTPEMEGPLKKLATRASETLGSNSNRRRPLDPNQDYTSSSTGRESLNQLHRRKPQP